MSNTCLLYDKIYLEHDTGMFHPETSARLSSVYSQLLKAPWFGDLEQVPAVDATKEDVALVHDPKYVCIAEEVCQMGLQQLPTGDTAICRESYHIAMKAVGGVLSVVDRVMTGQAKNGFCAVRPPGHHANGNLGMGFCMFNNIAVAARYAQKKYNVDRVLIADWDVHHGNGTQDIFYQDDTVFFMSTHQSPWYPGSGHLEETGSGKGKGFTINRPFSAGAGNEEIIGAFRDDFLPAAREFKPDLTLLSAGFDSRINDPLGGFRINDEGFRELTKIMLEISNISGNGRLVSLLEGGYHLQGLAMAVEAHVHELTLA
jgi:acetoin utilization deacetylase AcuC-like enzyme